MSKKNYNVSFNLHTVSGIVISVVLYIIFFAGSFSFFRDEIGDWQKGEQLSRETVDTKAVLNNLDKEYNLLARDVEIRFNTNQNYVSVYIESSKDTLVNPNAKESDYISSYNTKNSDKKTYLGNYNIGNFLFRLHFLDVIPYGRPLVMLIAVFFLFVMISGVIVHWKKIVPNFYVFNPKSILKKLWTDAHTALGVIGLPFQFIYAFTGTFIIVEVLALTPMLFLFNNNEQLLEESLSNKELYSSDWVAKSENKALEINPFITKTENYWNGFKINECKVYNYGGTNMTYKVNGDLNKKDNYFSKGSIIYDAYSGKIVHIDPPHNVSYINDIEVFLKRLHYANFGGVTMKIIYFIFGIITCFVIITGVLIWIESRNKKSMTLKQRKYTARVGHIYLAICLSMLPVTSISFVFVRITNGMFENAKDAIYWFYIITWLLFILFYSIKKDNYFTNKNSLLLGAIFGFLVPIVNGITSGNWFWKMYANGQYEIFKIDMLWIIVASISLLFYVKIKPSIKRKSSFASNPIEG